MAVKKKVLLVAADSMENTGVPNVIMNIVRGLHEEYQFDLVCFSKGPDYFDAEFLGYGGHMFRMPSYQGRSSLHYCVNLYTRGYLSYGKVRRLLKENGPYAAVHCMNDFESWYFLKAARKEHVPVRISHVHRMICFSKMKWHNRLIFKRRTEKVKRYATDKIGCSSMACASFYGENDYQVLTNSYNDQKFNRARTFEVKEHGIRLLQIGTYSDRKNQIFSLQVLSHLCRIFPEAELHFVGFDVDSQYHAQMDRLIESLHLQEHVTFWPHDADTPKLLSESSYLLFPSKEEAFGLVPVEAQAMGVRCFVSDDLIKDLDCGGVTFLPLAEGAKAWADVIAADYQATKGCHGEFDCHAFSIGAVMEEYRKMYERVKK